MFASEAAAAVCFHSPLTFPFNALMRKENEMFFVYFFLEREREDYRIKSCACESVFGRGREGGSEREREGGGIREVL